MEGKTSTKKYVDRSANAQGNGTTGCSIQFRVICKQKNWYSSNMVAQQIQPIQPIPRFLNTSANITFAHISQHHKLPTNHLPTLRLSTNHNIQRNTVSANRQTQQQCCQRIRHNCDAITCVLGKYRGWRWFLLSFAVLLVLEYHQGSVTAVRRLPLDYGPPFFVWSWRCRLPGDCADKRKGGGSVGGVGEVSATFGK